MNKINYTSILNWIKSNKVTVLLVLILLFSLVTKAWRLYYPEEHIFDEVYVRFTAEQIADNNPKTWVWDYASPKGFAYGWSHPQLGKMIMAGCITLLGPTSFASRLAPMIAGVLISLVTFFLSKHLFPKRPYIWLMSAFFISLDGLVLALSRIGLADTMLTLFLLTSIYFLIRKKYIPSAVFWGFALSTKWTSLYLLPTILVILLTEFKWKKDTQYLTRNFTIALKRFSYYVGIGPIIHFISELTKITIEAISTNSDTALTKAIKPELVWSFLKNLPDYLIVALLFIIIYQYLYKKIIGKRITFFTIAKSIASYFGIGTTIYLLSYLPMLLYGYTIDKFIQLQNQMFWYHTGLDATHAYQSPAFSWPLDIRPVWFWVDYTDTTIANIYALGNPVILWLGFIAVFVTIGYFWISRERRLFYLLLTYITFWVPWSFSPRIMFLYHYLPAIPYLVIILSFILDTISIQSKKLKYLPVIIILLAALSFFFFYPYITGIPVPKDEVTKFQWLKTWK